MPGVSKTEKRWFFIILGWLVITGSVFLIDYMTYNRRANVDERPPAEVEVQAELLAPGVMQIKETWRMESGAMPAIFHRDIFGSDNSAHGPFFETMPQTDLPIFTSRQPSGDRAKIWIDTRAARSSFTLSYTLAHAVDKYWSDPSHKYEWDGAANVRVSKLGFTLRMPEGYEPPNLVLHFHEPPPLLKNTRDVSFPMQELKKGSAVIEIALPEELAASSGLWTRLERDYPVIMIPLVAFCLAFFLRAVHAPARLGLTLLVSWFLLSSAAIFLAFAPHYGAVWAVSGIPLLLLLAFHSLRVGVAQPASFFRPLLLPLSAWVIGIPVTAGVGTWYPMIPGFTALAIIPFWTRFATSATFGIGLDKIYNQVYSLGQMSRQTAATSTGLSPKQLDASLLRHNRGQIIVDFANGILYSPSAISLKSKFAICATCNGATTVVSSNTVNCQYCDRNYHDSRQKPDVPGMPLAVEIVTHGMKVVSNICFSFAATLPLIVGFFTVLEGKNLDIERDFAPLAGISAFLCIGAGLTRGFAERIRNGQDLAAPYLLFALIHMPIFLLLQVRAKVLGPYVDLFFKKKSDLSKVLHEKGEMSIAEVSTAVGATLEEAIDYVNYACRHGIIDGVYDRVRQKLVSRTIFDSVPNDTSCGACGGILGISNGRVECQYCGESAATSGVVAKLAVS